MSRLAQSVQRLVDEMRRSPAQRQKRRGPMQQMDQRDLDLDVEPEGGTAAEIETAETAADPGAPRAETAPPAAEEGAASMAKTTAKRGGRAKKTAKKTAAPRAATRAAKSAAPRAAAVPRRVGKGKRPPRLCVADAESRALLRRVLKAATLSDAERALADAIVRRIDYIAQAEK